MLFDEFWLKSQALFFLLFIIRIVNYWSATVKIKHFDMQDILKVAPSSFCCKNTVFYKVSAFIISDQVFHTLPSDFECMYEQ